MAGLLDYIEAPFQSVGGLFGGAQQAPPPAQQAAPQPMLSAAQGGYVPPPVPAQRGAVGDVLDELLFGGALQRHAANEQARQMQIYQGQRLQQIYNSLPDDQKAAFNLDPAGYAKAIDDGLVKTAKQGETVIRPGIAGGTVTAPVMGMTSDNQAYTQTPFSTYRTGGLPVLKQHPLTDSVEWMGTPGMGVPPSAPTPQQVYGPAGGPPAGAPALGQLQPPTQAPQAPPGAPQVNAAPPQGLPQGPQQALPRGLRNNNPGNVKALPNGQMWAGQTGTDDQGYAVFADPKDGVHATLTNLDAYATRHGISTPQAIAARWSPGSPGYGQFIAQQLGVKPGDHINLKDPSVQGQVAQAIFKMENGPQAMQTRFPAASAPAQPGQPASSPTAQPGALPTSIQGQRARQMTPDEAKAAGYAPGAVVMQNPDGTRNVQQEGFTPQVLDSVRGDVVKSKQYDEYTQGNDAYKAMIAAANLHPGGMRAYALRDTFARVINPGAVARVGTIQAIKEAQGLPASVQAFFMNLKGDGDVPPQIAQQILDVAHGFAKSHYDSAKALNDANTQVYTPLGVDPRRVTAPMDDEPARFVLGAGPVLDPARAAKLQPGTSFVGLDGKKRVRK